MRQLMIFSRIVDGEFISYEELFDAEEIIKKEGGEIENDLIYYEGQSENAWLAVQKLVDAGYKIAPAINHQFFN